MKFNDLQKICDTYRLYKDRGLVKMVVAAAIANQLSGKKRKPVWIVFVAPPGGGKSDITGTLCGIKKNGKKLCEEISDLTTTSFASGMRSVDGETSLLLRINKNGGILLFKDFTTLLSKRNEDLAALMSQLREIYDGKFEKKFGNAKEVKWEGKVGVIASCTTIIYHKLGELSVMGDRLMMYQVEQPDRLEVQDKIWSNEDSGVDGEEEMGIAMKEYVEGIIKYIEETGDSKVVIDGGTRKEFGEIANFITIARSGVVWNYKKDYISYVPDVEMPTRVLRQLIAVASALMVINGADGFPLELTDHDRQLLYKLAFDSIPNMRRNVIKTVASYSYGGNLESIAHALSMPAQSVQIWLDELTAVGILNKEFNQGSKKDYWTMKDKFMPIVKKYEGVVVADGDMAADSSDNEPENGAFQF